ncbi:MAG: Ig-like domain-containing protein [Terracidiphilus sp.]
MNGKFPQHVASTLLLALCTVLPAAGATATTTRLSASTTTPYTGATVTLTAAVSPSAATGKVIFYDGKTALSTVTLSAGKAMLSTAFKKAGTHQVSAVYQGSASYKTSSDTLTITAVTPKATDTVLKASPTEPIAGASVTLTATVSPVPSYGQVAFRDGSTTLAQVALTAGTAVLKTSFSKTGAHKLTAAFEGTEAYTASTSSTVTVTVVEPKTTTTTLTTSKTTPAQNESVSLTAKVNPAAATGAVTFLENSSAIGTATLSGGAAALKTSFPAAGAYSLRAVYAGASPYGGSSSSIVEVYVNSTVSGGACGLQDSQNGAYSTAAAAFSSGGNYLYTPSFHVSGDNESAVCAEDGGTTVTLLRPAIVSSGNGASQGDSSFYGTSAAVLAYGASDGSTGSGSINVTGGSIETSGAYANGVFASGPQATVNISGTVIKTTGINAHGLDAAMGGILNITGATATTTSASSSVVATDRGGGTVTVIGGSYTASGQRSAGIYSTGVVTVLGGNFTAKNAEAVVVEGANSVTITGDSATYGTANLSGAFGDGRGIFLYQSTSGDAAAGGGTFIMTGGSLKYTCDATATASCASGSAAQGQNNPATLFSVANTTASITLDTVAVTNNTRSAAHANGTLLTAAALNSGTWGQAGQNGGNVTFTARGTALKGDVIVDSISTAGLTLAQNSKGKSSSLTGAIDTAGTGKSVSLTLDSNSTWTVTGASYLTSLNGLKLNGKIVENIEGNGHCVYYAGTVNNSGSATVYTLSGSKGGRLAPKGATGLACE